MGGNLHSEMNYGQYDCSLEELSSRNRSILIWLSIGVVWFWLFAEVFNIQWFWQEFYTAATESGWQVDTTDCEITVYDRCERYVSTGGIWWALLAVLLSGISVGPLVFAGIIFTYRTKDVTHEWKEKIWTLLFFINPSMIWAFLWLICLPFTWGLLPWGEWSTNWWKIFPFGFGLAWLALLPPFFCLLEFFKTLFNPEYTLDQKTEQIAETESEAEREEKEESSSTASEPLAQDSTCDIVILEATEGKPIRFKVNNQPSGHDAWFGLYPEQATDYEHGEHHQNWMYFRDVGQNELSLPTQPPVFYSIRVFSDNGYNLVAKHRFEVTKKKPEAEKVEDDENRRIQEVLEKEHSSSTSESIEIIGRVAPNQPVRFRINRTRWGRDAWVGIYPAGAPDQDHGEQNKRWKYIRDVDVNDITLLLQAEGNWSIRVFSDGGYNLEHRLDFEIHGSPQQPSTPTSSEGIVEGKVAFKSVHGKYLSAQPDGRAEWNRDRADVWEYFHLEKREGGKIALKGAHGMYVSAQPDGSVQINRGAAPEGGWEEFTVETHFIQPVGRGGYDVVCLKSCHGKYLSAQQDSTAQWNRDHAPRGGWEDIEMEYQGEKTHPDAERLHQSQACEIHIVEATEGKPIRFKVNNRPSGNDAWVGIYSAGATDQDHGEQNKRWKWLREIDVNDATLPPQAEGNWSIRVFSDGGFNQIGRLDFDITEVHDSTSFGQPHHARRGNSEIDDEEAIRLYKKTLDDHGVPSDFLAGTQTSRGQPASNSAKKIQSATKDSSESGSTNFWDSIE